MYIFIYTYINTHTHTHTHVYIWRERGKFCLWLGDARENCFNLESIIQHDRWIACQQGTKQMERRVYKDDNPPDTNYTHLHVKIFLPDILNSSGLDGGEFPRTQCKKCKPPWRTKGLCEKKWGKSLLDKDTWNGTFRFLPFIIIYIPQILAPSKGLIPFRYHYRKEGLKYFKT